MNRHKIFDVDSRRWKYHYKGKTYDEWAQELGVRVDTVRAALKKHGHLDGVGKGQPHNLIIYKGKTVKQWAEEFNVCKESIKNHLKKHGHLNFLKKIIYKGKTTKQWAQELNVCDNTIRVHLKKWGHLKYANLPPKEYNLVIKLKKDEENSEIFN